MEVRPTMPVPHSSPSSHGQQSTWKNNTFASFLGDMTVQEVPSPNKRRTFMYLEANLHVARISHKVGGTAVFNHLSQESVTSSCLGKPCHVSFKICSHLQHLYSKLSVPILLNFSSLKIWPFLQVVIYTPTVGTVGQL